MAKNETKTPAQAETPVAASTPTVQPNFTLVYRRDHPQNRSSYGIAGNPGIVVFDKGLFAGGVAPETITLSCEMVQPKPDVKAAKAEAAAAKLQERARKAEERIKAAQAKAEERKLKAEEAAKKAQERVAAAQAAAASKVAQ